MTMRRWLRGHWVSFLYWCVFQSRWPRLERWAERRIHTRDWLDEPRDKPDDPGVN